MEKEKSVRKKSTEKYAPVLPVPPPDPLRSDLPEAFKRIIGYKDREATFLKTLNETIQMENLRNSSTAVRLDEGITTAACVTADVASRKITPPIMVFDDCGGVGDASLTEECDNYVLPLLKRTGPSISAALVTEGAIDQLDKLHGILEQLLHMQAQNYKLRRNTRDVETLNGLQKLQQQIQNPEAFINSNVDLSDPEFEMELEYNESLLETILAAGKSASNKRNSSRRYRLRSKSVLVDEINATALTPEKDFKQYPLRRQSAITDIKAKVSKWTKVKAAFKWERANPSLNDSKSTDSGIGLSPINNEVARYLRVPSIPCTGSSADSVLSSSSGHMLSGGSIPPTPGTMSSASSIEDVGAASEDFRNNRDSSKSESRCESRTQDDDARRSRSLDGDVTLCSSFSRQLDKQSKNKTPWRKVKDIIQTHRGSFKGKSRSRSVKSAGSVGCSRDASPCDSVDVFPNVDPNIDRTESCSSSQTSPIRKNYPTLMLTAPVFDAIAGGSPTSPSGQTPFFGHTDNYDYQRHPPPIPPHSSATGTTPKALASRSSARKSKMVLDIACLPEGVPLDIATLPASQRAGKPPPSPLNLSNRQVLIQDSSDNDQIDHKTSPLMHHRNMNWTSRNRKMVVSGNASAPNSPSQQFEFFGEFESEDLSSGDFSEPCTPHMKLSPKNSLAYQQDEINRKYYELQQQISLEFQAKQREWERIRLSSAVTGNNAAKEDTNTTCNKDSKNIIAKPIEENLTPDFKKKLQEWRIKQSQSNSSVKDLQTSSPTKESDGKKIDWHLWKTGQIKLEGQGLKQMPDEKDLPEDFQKKLDEWKRIKATGAASTTETTVKRQSLKSNQLLKYEFGSSKKLKCSSDDLAKELGNIERERQRLERERIKYAEREKLLKLKSMVAEPPAKEVVVQTSKGVLKFEGISRKFTRKLYEWEKARGIGPEASTFALLHPGYRPLVVGNGEGDSDTGSPMGRSLSMDSVSPHASVPSISHQPSSLSLNNVDDLIETNSITDRRASSNSAREMDDDGAQEDEPEACIVEVEDDYVETADSLFTATPMIEQQTPVYRYEQTRKEYYGAGKKEAVFLGESKPNIELSASKALKDATKMVTSLKEVKHGFKENILHVQTVLRSLVDTLPTLKTNLKSNSQLLQESVDIVKDLAKDIIVMLTKLEESASSKEDLEEKMTAIDGQLNVLRKTLNFICKHTAEERKTSRTEDLPAISITPDETERNIAIVSVAPAVFQGQVVINQVKIMHNKAIVHETCSRDLPPPPPSPPIVDQPPQALDSQHHHISDCDNSNKNTSDTTGSSTKTQITEQDVKKISRNLNNGAKRKVKLRRLGSRQNSKEESDSDEDPQSIVLDTPRRIKRKTSRAKRATDSVERTVDDPVSIAASQPNDDVVYVLKIKPGQMIEQTEVSFDYRTHAEDGAAKSLADPCTGSVENVNVGNVFVKTKRKLFSPADSQSSAVIGKDLESSSGSEKIDNDTPFEDVTLRPGLCVTEEKVIRNLPPLPQSPSAQRRLEQKANPPKEPSPAIRIMIAKYNQRLSAERRNSSPQSSGSCSPVAWRSPVLERRVRTQTEKYLCSVTKSSSAGNVQREVRLSEAVVHQTDVSVPIKGVLKSSSAGIIPSNWTASNDARADPDIACGTFLACDSLKKISSIKKEPFDKYNMPFQFDEKHERVYRKNTEYPILLPIAVSKSGTYRKILSKPLASKEESSSIEPSNTEDVNQDDLPDKSTNTLPKIKRKYDAKPPSPKSQQRTIQASLELNIRNAILSSTGLSAREHSPDTPLSERAQKLRKAKEDFLKMSAHRSACYCQGEEVWKNRLSQISAGSESSADEHIIMKSASVGMINSSASGSEHPRSSTAAAGYVSLPRNATRNSKSQGTIGKFGFSTIASKLRNVTLRKNSKELPKMNAVSTLCRQSLLVEISKAERGRQAVESTTNADGASSSLSSDKQKSQSTEKLRKSGSTHAMGLGSLLFRRQERAEKLKKSKSIGQLDG